jgi:hypothetical protein
MQIVIVILVVTALLAAACRLVTRAGLRAGDHPGDSRVTVRLGARPQADTAGAYAQVRVDNFGTVPVVASATVEPIAAWTLPLRAPMSVRVPPARRRVNAPDVGTHETEQVVVVDGGGVAGIFEVALPPTSNDRGRTLRAVRVDVTIHQEGGRVRIMRFALPVPPAPPAPPVKAATPDQPVGSPTY